MKRLLTRLVVLALIAGGAWLLWSNRHHIALIENNNFRLKGEWHRVSMNFKEDETYDFSEGFIRLDGEEWGTYVLRKNTELEITVGNQVSTYILEFPDDENMVWMVETKRGLEPSIRWRR
jgi:hypothetical protein